MRYRRVRFLGSKASQSEALHSVREPAELILVERGVPRSLVMKCPDGCGETLTVNLDRRVGKAWRFYNRPEGVSLYPSVWRTTGCRSHFIIWENGIYWNDGRDEYRTTWEHQKLTRAVTARLSHDHFISPEAIAAELEEVPWAIDSVCRNMVRTGVAVAGAGELEGWYKLRR